MNQNCNSTADQLTKRSIGSRCSRSHRASSAELSCGCHHQQQMIKHCHQSVSKPASINAYLFMLYLVTLATWCPEMYDLLSFLSVTSVSHVFNETCCTRLTENIGRNKVAKNRHLGTIAQLCQAISSQLRHISTIGKKLVKQQYVLHISPQYGELRPTSGWDQSGSLRHPCKFQRVSYLGSVTARHLVVGVSQTLWR